MRAMPLVFAVVYLLATAVPSEAGPGPDPAPATRRRARRPAPRPAARYGRRALPPVRPGEIGPVPGDRARAGTVQRDRLRRSPPGLVASGERRADLHRRGKRRPLGQGDGRFRHAEPPGHLPGHRQADLDPRPRAAARRGGLAGPDDAGRRRVRALLPVDRDRAGAEDPRHAWPPGRPASWSPTSSVGWRARVAGWRRPPTETRPHPRNAVPPPDTPLRADRAGVNRRRLRAPAGRGHAACTSTQAHDQPASRRTVATVDPMVALRQD